MNIYTQENVKSTQTIEYNLIKSYFNSNESKYQNRSIVFPAIGNHDTAPSNHFILSGQSQDFGSSSWLYSFVRISFLFSFLNDKR